MNRPVIEIDGFGNHCFRWGLCFIQRVEHERATAMRSGHVTRCIAM